MISIPAALIIGIITSRTQVGSQLKTLVGRASPLVSPLSIGCATVLGLATIYFWKSANVPKTSLNPSSEHSSLQNLEAEFESEVFCDVDVTKDCNFKDYLIPNERNPYNILPHLNCAGPGIIVSTGTERSFFDLILADPSKCIGLVIRDINPRVKAYVDFNILLLKIARTREEYVDLSKVINDLDKNSLKERINLISKLIK